MTTTERLVTGVYHIIDKNGYQIASVIKANRRTRPWIITFVGGTPGGATATLKEAARIVNDRWEG